MLTLVANPTIPSSYFPAFLCWILTDTLDEACEACGAEDAFALLEVGFGGLPLLAGAVVPLAAAFFASLASYR